MDTDNAGNTGFGNSNADTGTFENTDINILRSKTFNRELKHLVNRIVSNEEKPGEEDIESLTEDRLLYRLHKLFYLIRSLNEIESANTSFNPFLMEDRSGPDKGIGQYLKSSFQDLGISVYDILTFNINDKCFSSTHTELTGESRADIIINLKDNLFKRISREQKGSVLTYDEITGDSFLSKKFNGLDDEKRGMLLFLRLSSITVNLIEELNRGEKSAPLVEYLSPIMVFRIKEQSSGEVDTLVRTLKDELSVPLFLSLGGLFPSFKLDRYDDPDSLIILLETILTVSVISDDYNGILIKASRSCDTQMIFEIKYMISRLTKNLDDHTSVLRIKSDALLLITLRSKRGIVESVIADYNTLHNDLFEYEVISEKNRDEIPELLLKICF